MYESIIMEFNPPPPTHTTCLIYEGVFGGGGAGLLQENSGVVQFKWEKNQLRVGLLFVDKGWR